MYKHYPQKDDKHKQAVNNTGIGMDSMEKNDLHLFVFKAEFANLLYPLLFSVTGTLS